MSWKSKVLPANQMLSSCLFLFFKSIPSPSWIFVLTAALISFCATYLVLGFGFLSVFLYTSLILVFTTIFCGCTALNHHNAICVHETKGSIEENSDQREDITEAMEEHEEGEYDDEKEEQEIMSTFEETDETDNYWPLDQSVDGSDEGSISDEESLIEIALPTGNCSLKHQQEKHNLKVMSDLLAEFNFDMNEEDNLIEIDISMGSIKSYPARFEIHA